jgi:hypothetical protein
MRPLLVSVAVLSCLPVLLHSQVGGYVVRMGEDTVAVERFERTTNRIDGQIVRRLPQTSILRYALTFTPQGTIATFEQSVLRPDGSAADGAPQRMTFARDSVVRSESRNGQTVTRRSPAPAVTLPSLPSSLLLADLLIGTARNTRTVYTISLEEQQVEPARTDVAFVGTDSAVAVAAGMRTGFRLGEEGHVVRVDAWLNGQRIVGQAVPPMNIGTIASAWAARERGTRVAR